MTEQKANPWDPLCPSSRLIALLASKWVLLVIPLLRQSPKRNSELLREMPGVSQKMLTQTLRELERNRLVARHDFAEVPPRVEYVLTPLGRSLATAVMALNNWVIRNYYNVAGRTKKA